MSRLWKIFVMASLALNSVCLLYVYALLYPNPYGQQYYETEQTKMELRQLKDELGETKDEIGKIKGAILKLNADVVTRK